MSGLRAFLVPAAFAAATLLTGCVTDAVDDGTLDPAVPIASLALTNGNRLEFYEASPGALLIAESGVVGAIPTPYAGRTSVELYRDLAPGQDVPTALLAADARAKARKPEIVPAEEAAKPPLASLAGPAMTSFIDNQSCDDQWFSNTFCGGSWDWQMCLLNHWNGAFAQLSSVDYVRHAVCADIGAVTLRVQMGDGKGVIQDVPEGQWASFWWQDGCVFGCNTSTRGDVLNASGDRFHYSVHALF